MACLTTAAVGTGELGDDLERGVDVEEVRVRETVPFEHLERTRAEAAGRTVDRGLLVGVLTVPEAQRFPLQEDHARERVIARGRREETGGDGGVVLGHPLERPPREPSPGPGGDGARVLSELFEQGRIVGGIRHDGHSGVVLRGGADERDPTDVDVLLTVGRLGCFAEVLLEGVEIDDDEVEREETPVGEFAAALVGARREDTAQQGRVEGLHAAAEPGSDARELLGGPHREAGRRQARSRPAGGPKLDPELLQPAGQVLQSRSCHAGRGAPVQSGPPAPLPPPPAVPPTGR